MKRSEFLGDIADWLANCEGDGRHLMSQQALGYARAIARLRAMQRVAVGREERRGRQPATGSAE